MTLLRKIAVLAGMVLLAVGTADAVRFVRTVTWRGIIGPRMRPVTNRTFERTPERLARGKYLVDGVALCSHCHSPQDWTRHDRPIPPGMYLSGQIFPDVTNAGLIVPPNLTPDPETGLGKWTDDEIARAIREGVDRDGHALVRTMPFWRFKNLPDEDLASIVVYLRSLPPVHHVLPKTKLRYPLNYTINNLPEPVTKPVPPRDLSTPEKRGEYLADLGQCFDCHTKAGRKDLAYAGGSVFRGPWGALATANITQDASGIKYYDEKLFKQVMRTGYAGTRPLTYMPWVCFRYMTDQDIDDLWSYVKTFKPVQHIVDNTEKPTFCPLCGSVHGYGDRNVAHVARASQARD